jgi:hypothetical protein
MKKWVDLFKKENNDRARVLMALSKLYGVCISIKCTELKLNVNTQNPTIKDRSPVCNKI